VTVLRARPIALLRMQGAIGVGIRHADWVPVLDGLRRRGRVKAVVIDIDSPGGGAAASDLIHEAVRRLAEVKPVVAFSGNLCASGGYLIASAATRFMVARAAAIGSIGVISVRPLAYDLMARLGVAVEVAKSDELKDMGAFWRPPTEKERQREQALVDEYYDMFMSRVEAGRKLEPERLRPLATGEVFTGRRSVETGLADELGTFEDAVKLAARLAGVRERTRWYGPRRPLRARLLGPLGASLADEVNERLLALTVRQPRY
jgi:protease-4